MTPDSCFVRIGSSIQSMSMENILNLFSKRTRNNLKNIKAPNQSLEFKVLKIYYQEKGFEVNDNILNKLQMENKIYTKIETPTRKEIKMFDFDAVKELVTNAIIHNDWCNGYSPKFEIFDEKLVISSNGGIQEGVNQEEFLEGFSNPRNPELMRVFRDLNFVEQLGTGIQRVLKVYPKDIFEFFPNHIRVTINFKENEFLRKGKSLMNYNQLNEIQNSILKLIMDKPNITQEELARLLGVTIKTISRNFKVLIDNSYIRRIGANKNGYWELIKK